MYKQQQVNLNTMSFVLGFLVCCLPKATYNLFVLIMYVHVVRFVFHFE